MTIFILSCIAALIPTVFYMVIIYLVDRYEKEPIWLLLATFVWGAVPSIIAALIFNTLFTLPVYYLAGPEIADAFGPIVSAPIVEEILKGLALLGILLLWRHELDSILDGIIYGAMVGLGFGMVEDVFYYVSTYAEFGYEGWIGNIIARTLFSLNHSLFSAMTGMGIATARLTKNPILRWTAPFLGLAAGMFLHFVHNAAAVLSGAVSGIFCLILPINAWGGVLVTLLIIIWALRQERTWIREYLAEEVEMQVLTPRQYALASSSRQRTLYTWGLLGEQGFGTFRTARRFFHHCAELAYKKKHFASFKDKRSASDIVMLRQQVGQLSRELNPRRPSTGRPLNE